MTEYTAARFVEKEAPELSILRDETRLLPKRIARRRGDAAHNHIAHLAFRMAVDDIYGFGGPHLKQAGIEEHVDHDAGGVAERDGPAPFEMA